MSARDDVLARIRAALPTTRTQVVVPRDYERADCADAAASLDLLVDRLEDYRATVHRCSPQDVPAVLARLLSGRVVVPGGFPEAWLSDVTCEVVRDLELSPRELDGLDAVLTTCALAIASTGTVVLDAGPGQGRRALTLVPDRHVLVVTEQQVVGTVPSAMTRLDPTSPQTWISGPSATSDIELQRVEGVHGPRQLEVVLVSSTSPAL